MLNALYRRVVRIPSRVGGYTRYLRQARAHLIAITMYHGIILEPLPTPNSCQLEISHFEEQIQFLTAEYRVLPLREVIDRLERGLSLPNRTVAVTFDDGFRSVWTNAYPLLQRYQIPFTVFLITGLVGSNQRAWPDRLFSALAAAKTESLTFDNVEFPLRSARQRARSYVAVCSRLKQMPVHQKDEALAQIFDSLGTTDVPNPVFELMNWEEIRSLSKTGLADFGSHTNTHQILSRCDHERQKSELQKSRDMLLDHTGAADMFAYPNGTADDFTLHTKGLLKELNYRCGLTTITGLNNSRSDLYELRRVGIGSGTTLSSYALQMLGF